MRRSAAPVVLALLGLVPLLGGCGKDGDKHGARLKVTLSYGAIGRPYMPQPEEVAKQVAGDLEEAGFEVVLDKQDWAAYLQSTREGKHQMALMGWSADIPDVDNFLYVLLDKTNARVGSADNISFYTDEAVHTLLEKARYTYDEGARAVLYRSAQERILDDAPMVPLAFSERVIAHKKGFEPLGLEQITHPLLRLVKTPRDGRLVFARSGDAVKLDPGLITDGESSNVVEQVYDQLVRYKPGTTEVVPSLAQSWSHDPTSTTWTFRLRPGVTFHDGTPCDAAAVANAFERQRDPKHKHHVGGEFGYWSELLDYVKKVEPGTGEGEVVFRLERPAPAFFLATLGVFAFSIPSPAALDKYGEEFGNHPVGTGPFRFVSWQKGVEIVLQRNDGYWDGAPALREVVYRKAGDAASRTQQLRAGEADLIDNVDLATLPQLEGDAKVVVVRQPGMHVAYLAMNTQKAPFDQKAVRQAVAFALDKRRLLQAGWEGRAQPAVSPVPPSLAGAARDLQDRPRDVAKARALLDEALGSK